MHNKSLCHPYGAIEEEITISTIMTSLPDYSSLLAASYSPGVNDIQIHYADQDATILGKATLDKELPYYFQIEAVNENGVSQRTKILRSE